jgi:hypothetical protein
MDSNLKYNPDASYHHIENKIPLDEDVFTEWMNKNANPKVLIEKIFYDICSETGHFENNVMYITKKMIGRYIEISGI